MGPSHCCSAAAPVWPCCSACRTGSILSAVLCCARPLSAAHEHRKCAIDAGSAGVPGTRGCLRLYACRRSGPHWWCSSPGLCLGCLAQRTRAWCCLTGRASTPGNAHGRRCPQRAHSSARTHIRALALPSFHPMPLSRPALKAIVCPTKVQGSLHASQGGRGACWGRQGSSPGLLSPGPSKTAAHACDGIGLHIGLGL